MKQGADADIQDLILIESAGGADGDGNETDVEAVGEGIVGFGVAEGGKVQEYVLVIEKEGGEAPDQVDDPARLDLAAGPDVGEQAADFIDRLFVVGQEVFFVFRGPLADLDLTGRILDGETGRRNREFLELALQGLFDRLDLLGFEKLLNPFFAPADDG